MTRMVKVVKLELDSIVPTVAVVTCTPGALTDLCNRHNDIFAFCLGVKVVSDPPQCSTPRLI